MTEAEEYVCCDLRVKSVPQFQWHERRAEKKQKKKKDWLKKREGKGKKKKKYIISEKASLWEKDKNKS